ncbi:hypothetical protein LEP1GSC008_2597 [Leptospira kirschneri serovar Bulgarica str. Nikolaevo]|uniref:Uncharacterized protein n=1 Tax=Leptospira kirschneri serovar Bulgarica str. Nikolaevo TaxID=1240687 RepID=M6FEB8_9LEPT|nr:hypothetical protein LEP1GSC008_2597 [Leptospira kirschneri serovar Bulgarica str. Nikolaevo]
MKKWKTTFYIYFKNSFLNLDSQKIEFDLKSHPKLMLNLKTNYKKYFILT